MTYLGIDQKNTSKVKILKKQHADPDFLLCRHGEKDWNGADPCCAFDESGKFREGNWNCQLMAEIRHLCSPWNEAAPGHYFWSDDQYYGVLYVSSWIDRTEVDSYLLGAFILLDWYKSRGATDSFRILQRNVVREGTEKDAQEIVRIYQDSQP